MTVTCIVVCCGLMLIFQWNISNPWQLRLPPQRLTCPCRCRVVAVAPPPAVVCPAAASPPPPSGSWPAHVGGGWRGSVGIVAAAPSASDGCRGNSTVWSSVGRGGHPAASPYRWSSGTPLPGSATMRMMRIRTVGCYILNWCYSAFLTLYDHYPQAEHLSQAL